jgi:DNA-directed RNA polymerase specialized sigma24 family protein
MGTTLQASSIVRRQLRNLTQHELELCVMHFVDGHSQASIAQWLGTTLRAVQKVMTSAVAKVPQLRPLRVKARRKPARPRLVHLSQIDNPRDRERGPFNADEI